MQSRLERRCIGLDVHRDFAQVAIWQGGVVKQAGRFATTPEGVRAFAQGLGPADEVALEVTGNTLADRLCGIDVGTGRATHVLLQRRGRRDGAPGHVVDDLRIDVLARTMDR